MNEAESSDSRADRQATDLSGRKEICGGNQFPVLRGARPHDLFRHRRLRGADVNPNPNLRMDTLPAGARARALIVFVALASLALAPALQAQTAPAATPT